MTEGNRGIIIGVGIVFLALIAVVVAVVLIGSGASTEATPTIAATAEIVLPEDTPSPPPEAMATPTSAGVADSVWERIQNSGTLVVGTSADFPPFEYYTNFEFDGLDIAIIREIGQRLGLTVQISDYAFEGLGDTLKLAQTDVVIAAISVTPERLAEFDFSTVYFVSDDAVLARDDATFTITTAEDLVAYRVGVQSGSVQADWVETNLINTGLMSPVSVQEYIRTADMVGALQEGFIDVVLADRQPADTAVADGGFQIVGGGLNRQLYAIGMPKGASELQAQLNAVLAEMTVDGTLADLIEQYVGYKPEVIVPPDIVTPEPIEPPTEECVDGMAWVSDLNFDDQNMTAPQPVNPGQAFQKGWRIRNVGTCTWNSDYKLGYVSGNVPAAQMGGRTTPIQGTVDPGQTYDMYVDLVAPAYPGTYQAFWQMFDAANVPFGQRIWVGISVPQPATPTPPPTQTPAPGIRFAANPTSIQQGQCSTLSWETSNIKAVYVYEQGQPWQNYGVGGSGQRNVCPATTKTYEMRVVQTNDAVEVRQVTIFVTPVPNAPIIARFTVSPNQIAAGQCVSVQWTVEGAVNSVRISRNGETLPGSGSAVGSTGDCPPGTGDVNYTLEATGPGGTSRQTLYVVVNAVVEPPPTATPTIPAPEPPVVSYFSVSPIQIEVGQCVNVSWGVGGGATTRIQIQRGEATILDNAPFNGSLGDCPTALGTVTYRVVASNNIGQTESQEQAITVSESKPENPLADTNWKATDIVGQPALEDVNVTAYFSVDGRLSGNGGCNVYNGTYMVDGNALTVSTLTITGVLCTDEINAQEQNYLTALQAVNAFQIVNDQLILSTGAEQEILGYMAID